MPNSTVRYSTDVELTVRFKRSDGSTWELTAQPEEFTIEAVSDEPNYMEMYNMYFFKPPETRFFFNGELKKVDGKYGRIKRID